MAVPDLTRHPNLVDPLPLLWTSILATRATYPFEQSHESARWLTACTHSITLRGTQTDGLVVTHADEVFVAFRGRKRGEDFRIGLTYEHVQTQVGTLHRGYHDELESVWPNLLAALYDARALDRVLVLCGHSGGGCIAGIAALRLHDMGFDVGSVVTFGTPRYLASAGVWPAMIPHIRVVNDGDPIPAVHWPSLQYAYEHAGEAMYLLESGALVYQAERLRTARTMERLEAFEAAMGRDGAFQAHSVEGYFQRMQRSCKRNGLTTT